MNLKDKTVVIDNKTYRYSKIVMLPTKNIKQSSILLGVVPNWSRLTKDVIDDHEWLKFGNPQHLYFLSTDKICEGDWFITIGDIKGEQSYCFSQLNKCLKKETFITTEGNRERLFISETGHFNGYNPNGDKYFAKIIATTNPECNLPKPSDSFLRVYIDAYNNKSVIEECLVEYEEFIPNNGINLNDGYHKSNGFLLRRLKV